MRCNGFRTTATFGAPFRACRSGRRLFFANQGAFRKGDYAEIKNKISALSLLSNAALAWNTVQIGVLIDGLKARGEAVSRETLARVSPLVHRHIIPSGTYRFRDQRPRLE